MKHILIAPDSFKGTLSSLEACEILKKSFSKAFKHPIITLPIADGGEGSCDAFLHVKKGKKIYLQSTNPNFGKCESFYALLEDGVAVIEMATTAGLGLADEKDPSKTTSFGVGEQIKDALQKGCKEIIICLGGSATNDAGCGLASALGAKFYDAGKKEFIPVGGSLEKIEHIDLSELKKLISKVKITTMCDITNPLYGEHGAAFVFAPQKGADEEMVKRLDSGLEHLNEKVKSLFGLDMQSLQGAGAAGGMGGGMVAFLGSELRLGIDIILQNANFEKLLEDTLFVVSGEGKIDSQSIDGKALCGISKKCKKAKVPLVCIVGGYEGELETFYKLGIDAIFSTNKMPKPLNELDAKQNLADTSLNVAKSLMLLKD